MPDGKLSDEVIRTFNEMFVPTVTDDSGNTSVTEISCFFTSYYDKPEDIDLAEFLRNCPIRTEVSDEEEFLKVKETAKFKLPADTLNDMSTPVWRYRREDVDALLQEYTGISTADLTGKTSGRSELVYVESTDSYYNFTSDFGAGSFNVVKGEKEGSIYYLWNSRGNCLTLRNTADGIKILSHTLK